MAHDEAAVARAQRTPARALLVGGVVGGARVQPQAGDRHVGVAGVGEDRHPAAEPVRAPAMNSEESSGVVEQARAVQREGHGARAVVAGRDERGVAAAEDVGQPDELVAGPDDLLDGGRRGHRRGREAVDVARASCPGTSSSGLVPAVSASAPTALPPVARAADAGRRGGRRADVGDDFAGRGLLVDRARCRRRCCEREVTGSRWSGGRRRRRVLVAGRRRPAAAPPVFAARAPGAPAPRCTIKLQTNALRVRTRKTATSFVGLRG